MITARTVSMANLSIISGLRCFNCLFRATSRWRRISSTTLSLKDVGEPFAESPFALIKDEGDDLKSQIFGLKYSGRSVTAVLHTWVRHGQRIPTSKLRRIFTKLLKSKRYEHALEILIWIENQNSLPISSADCAIRLELTMKVRGLTEAEDYFDRLSSTASRRAACLQLLHGYVKERNAEKAEALMVKLRDLGLILNPHLYNEMMKLYVAMSQCEKVPLVIHQMKLNQIPRNVLSYNLWVNACSQLSGVDSVEMVYKEMLNDKNVQVGWSTLSTLANVYIKAGLIHKAVLALKNAEKKLSTCNHLGYFFLITLYASLNNKQGVLRLWEASKVVGHRITCTNYMCILLCLVKLGDLSEAERIFKEWESHYRNYDIRVSNVLLGAYVRNGLIEKAESLHVRTLERGASPNYKTWEILMEGWMNSQNIEKVINAMKNAFSIWKLLCQKPSKGIT